eukprot:5487451-Pyramimonas_sp.AAC.1
MKKPYSHNHTFVLVTPNIKAVSSVDTQALGRSVDGYCKIVIQSVHWTCCKICDTAKYRFIRELAVQVDMVLPELVDPNLR